MIPGKPAKKESKALKPVSFKAPEDVVEYLDAVVAGGGEKSATIHRALRIVRDLAASLGIEDWSEVEKRAKVKGVSEGIVLAELVKQVLAVNKAEGATFPAPKKGGK